MKRKGKKKEGRNKKRKKIRKEKKGDRTVRKKGWEGEKEG